MYKRRLLLIGAVILPLFMFNSCEMLGLQKNKYSFWRGDIENFYYLLDMNDEKLQKVTGKPFMVLEYDPITGVPVSCEFGLSEAKNVYLPGAEGAIPEPFLSASTLKYAKKLDLEGSVALLCNWSDVSTTEELSAGGFEFTVDNGSDMWGHEILHFSFTFDDMTGEINNEEVTWGGRVSDVGAFDLIRRFNDTSL